MENQEISSNVPPTQSKTEGRKKIRIARIEDTRSRQVTFLKRKNGLLKKAMELGILCDCEVSVIIFNTSNGKLFEYSSVETEKVLQRYATYSGPSERRKKETFFDLSKSKGTSNIPLNEPNLAQAAMEAASVAVGRPRPTYKFGGAEETEGVQEYSSNGRKLSSGETPAGPLHGSMQPPTVKPSSQLRPYPAENPKRQKIAQVPLTSSGNGPDVNASIMVPPLQLPDLMSGRPSFMPFTPRLSTNIPLPAITPNTASRYISAAFGIPDATPRNPDSTTAPNHKGNPFDVPRHDIEESKGNEPPRLLQQQNRETFSRDPEDFNKQHSQDFSIEPQHRDTSMTDDNTKCQPHMNQTDNQVKMEHMAQSAAPQDLRDSSESRESCAVDCERNNSEQRTVPRVKPSLRVHIPDANRDEFTIGTPSGLNSLTTPSSGEENAVGALHVPRLSIAGISPTGNNAWQGWHSAGNVAEREGPIPLTPFLNMDALAGPSDMGNSNISLPSPSDAGLIPLTPRGFGLESLLSARTPQRSFDGGKLLYESSGEQSRLNDPRRPFA